MFNHTIKNGLEFRVDRDGGWWVRSNDRWETIETEAPIVSSESGFKVWLQGGYRVNLSAAEAMWLSSEAGIPVKDVVEGRKYVVALHDKFLAGED